MVTISDVLEAPKDQTVTKTLSLLLKSKSLSTVLSERLSSYSEIFYFYKPSEQIILQSDLRISNVCKNIGIKHSNFLA